MPGAREKDLNPDTWIGLSFPLGRSNVGFFKQTKTTLKQAAYNLENLLLTIPGERMYQPEFGSNLHTILFEPIEPSVVQDLIEEEIRRVTEMWLPYIIIKTITVQANKQNENMLVITITFTVPIDPNNMNSIALTFES